MSARSSSACERTDISNLMLQCRSDHLAATPSSPMRSASNETMIPAVQISPGYLAENGDFAKLANRPVKNGADEKRTSFGIR